MLDALRHFVLIVEHGTFTAAAKHAHLSQPALTASIRKLEGELGAKLLHRGRRGAHPTAAGEALIPRARAALAAVDDARRAVREVLDLSRGEVRIAAGATACTYLLPPTLAAFRRAHPKIRLGLRETTTEEALGGLEAGDVDLAVITFDGDDEGARSADRSRRGGARGRDAERSATLDGGRGGRAPQARAHHGARLDAQVEPWFDDELILVGAPGSALDRATFVSFRAGATTRALLEAHFPEARVAIELGGIAAVKSHVRAGMGVALVSRHAVATDLALGRLVRIDDPRTPVRRPLSVAHRGRDRLPPAAAALLSAMLAAPPVIMEELG